jgi:hypothetical protein
MPSTETSSTAQLYTTRENCSNTIYKGQRDIELALEYLECMRIKRIKYLGAVGDKQCQLEKCYKAIMDA